MSTISTALGIDPGYERCGWAYLEKEGQTLRVVDSGCIRSSTVSSLAQRYLILQTELSSILNRYQPTTAAIETLFFSRNAKTALKVSEARGVILATLAQRTMTIVEYAPNQIKQAVTGSGAADKKQIQKMISLLTKHEVSPKLDDEADAIAIAMCHLLRARTHAL